MGEWWPVSAKLTATGRGERGGECVAQMELSTGSKAVLCGAVLDVSEGLSVLHCTVQRQKGQEVHTQEQGPPPACKEAPDMQLDLEYHTNR
jgi:hypothetical protein